jgi:hypothetical protein
MTNNNKTSNDYHGNNKMGKEFLVGIFFGLAIASTAIYAWETKSNLIDRQNIEGIFFLIVAALHMPVAYWAVSKNSNLAWGIIFVGTVVIVAIFGLSRSESAFLVGREKPGGFGSLSVISKAIQVGILMISGWAILDNKKARQVMLRS